MPQPSLIRQKSGLCLPVAALLLQERPDITIDHVGAVNTGEDTDDNRQREFADGGDTQDAQRHDGNQSGDGGADGAAETLLDRDVGYFLAGNVGHLLGILADAVEDHDRVVDGISDDGQRCGDERRVIWITERKITMKDSMISTSCSRPKTAAIPEFRSKRIAI